MGDQKLRTKTEHEKIIKLRKGLIEARKGNDEELLLPRELNRDPNPKRWKSPISIINVLTETGSTAKTDEEMEYLTCKIDLNASLKTILTDLKWSIKFLRSFKKNFKERRVNIETLIRDMEIYKLCSNPNISRREIADKFFPEQFERNPSTAMLDLKRRLERIEHLIEGEDSI